MSKKRMSAATMKFLEECKEIERQHLEYLREVRAKHLSRSPLDAGAFDRASEAVYDVATDTYRIKTDALRYVWEAAPPTAAPVTAADTTDAAIKYLTLEQAMKLHREEEARKYYTVTREDATKWVKHGSMTWAEAGAPVRIEKNVRVAALSDGTYPEVGMRVMHDGITFEIERIEIETPSWRTVAVGHAVGDVDTFVAGAPVCTRAP